MLVSLVTATAEASITRVSEPLQTVAAPKESLTVMLTLGPVPDVNRGNCSSRHAKIWHTI